MTEDEAKTKMCCGSPLIAAATLAMHPESIVDAGEAGKCIASACMAWRWGGPHSPPSIEAINEERAGGSPLDAVRTLNRKNPPGFCGLAGAPA